ncbi:MAG TPA: hypothetical protein VGS11_03935 [Candidatus Bathyarchaeia archaeon]|nr:hypothetical protein [Candidatus Bathyarchaeia archaeon]
MNVAHGKNASLARTPEELAASRREIDLLVARQSLIARAALLLGIITVIVGLALVSVGSNNLGILTCRASACFIPQSLIDQIRSSGYGPVYVAAQQTVFGGLLLVAIGFTGLAYWPALRVGMAQRIQFVLLVGIFMLVLVTSLAIAGGIIPFGQRIIPPSS